MADYGPFAPAQPDFSWLGNLPNAYAGGVDFKAQQDLKRAFSSPEVQQAIQNKDYGSLARIMGQYNPELATKMLDSMNSSQGPFGLNPIWTVNNDTKENSVYQSSKEGGPPVKMQFPPGEHPVAPQTYLSGPTGFTPYSTRNPSAPSGPVIPKDVQGAASQEALGKRNIQLEATYPHEKLHISTLRSSLNNLADVATQVKSLASPQSTGIVGAGMAHIPNTDAYRLRANLETIKGNVAFGELSAMRESSPTGSGLGQISNFEDQLLGAIRRSMDPNIGADDLKKNMDIIVDMQKKLQQYSEQAFKDTYGVGPDEQRPETLGYQQNQPAMGTNNASPYAEGGPTPSANDMQMLHQYANDPAFQREFESHYGAGSVERWLGQGEWGQR